MVTCAAWMFDPPRFCTVVLVVCIFMQVLVSAAEAAEMILRVDDIIKCAPRERDHHH
jgi:hypothetical protein